MPKYFLHTLLTRLLGLRYENYYWTEVIDLIFNSIVWKEERNVYSQFCNCSLILEPVNHQIIYSIISQSCTLSTRKNISLNNTTNSQLINDRKRIHFAVQKIYFNHQQFKKRVGLKIAAFRKQKRIHDDSCITSSQNTQLNKKTPPPPQLLSSQSCLKLTNYYWAENSVQKGSFHKKSMCGQHLSYYTTRRMHKVPYK